MNVLRRVLLAFYSVVLIAAAGGAMALTWNNTKKLDLVVRDFNLQAFVVAGDTAKWIVTAILAGVTLLGLLTFVAAVAWSRSQRGGTLRLRQADGGMVEVTAEAVEALLRDELERLPDIRQVDPHVRLSGGAVDTEMTVVVEPSASIAHVTATVTQATAQALREQIGVTNVRRPTIRISYEEINVRAVPVRGRSKPQVVTSAAHEETQPPAATEGPGSETDPRPGTARPTDD